MALSITRGVRSIVSGIADRYMYSATKQRPMMWPEWMNGNPQWRMVDLKGYYDEGFNMNSLIYSAIMWKAKNITQAPIRAYEGDYEHPELLPIKHPLSRLMKRPNEFQSQQMFMTLNEVFLNATGNSFILMDRPSPNAPPIALYPLNPDRVQIVPINSREVGYLYVPEGMPINNGIPIVAADMMHVKLPNPRDPLEGQGYGLSPMSPLAQSADADNRVTRYMYNLFKRGLMLGGILSFKTPISEATAARTRRRWQDQYGGSDKWVTEIGILDQGAEYQRIAPTFDELGFGGIDERNETRLLMPFGVPPIVIGSRIGLMRSTYSNYEQARKAAWEDTLNYEINLFSDEMEYHLSSDEDTFVAADTSNVAAFQENLKEQVDAAKVMFDMGTPARNAYDTAGVEVEEYEGMDISYLAMGLKDANAEPEPVPDPLQTVNDLTQPPKPKKPTAAADEGTVSAANNEKPQKAVLSGKKKAQRPIPTHRW